MFEQLLKYPIDIFRQGDFYFGIRLPGLILFLIFVGLIAASIWAYRTTQGRTHRGFRGFLIFLRTLALCGLAFCLLKPFVTVYQTSPDDSYLAVLLDESKSMQVTDSVNQESRLSSMNNLLFDPEVGILNALDEKFKTRLFSFSGAPKRMAPAALAEANGETTDIPAALNETLENLQGVPLSGVVVFSDGADASGEDITKLAFRMRDRKVPVHTVGIGSPEGIKDIEVVKVDAPRTAEEDFPVEIWATIRRKGYGPREVTLRLRDENRVVKTFNVNLNKERPTRRIRIKFIPRNPGTQKYVVEIPAETDEAVPQNNTKKFLLKVAPSKRVKILYVEGGLRPEIGLIRRTLEKDPNIQLTLRYFTSKTTIGGASDGTDHKFDLYPTSKEVLFDYDAIIFGNIASSKFTRQQLENTVEFIRTRGGGFLMLGGKYSLGNHNMEDAYINTPIAQILPVELELGTPPAPSPPIRRFATPPQRGRTPSIQGYALQLTAEGKADPLMALADEPRENVMRWEKLPTLASYSRVQRAKAGATVLAVHPTDRNEFGNRILIATHNYNAGRVMVFTPVSPWNWQMHLSHEDDSHERFWRQTAKWLTTVQKDQLKLDIPKTSYTLKEAVIINATAYNHQFELTDQAKVRAVITDENGRKRELSLEQVLGQDGLYTARFIPPRRGEYRVTLVGTLGGKSLGEQSGLFEVAESYAEFTNAELNAPLLQTLANTSGGRYYTLEDAAQMANHIPLVESATSRLVDEEVWDMPLIFGVVILLLGLEWFLRKRRGLA
jgi:uncharacterized membrane protein